MDIADVKRNLNKLVLHNGHDYILDGVMIRLNGKEFWYQAELLDTGANSIVRCRLEDVDAK